MNEQQIRAIVRDEVTKIITKAFRFDTFTEDEYLPTSEAWKRLGFISHKQLLRAVNDGLLREGKEYQDRRLPDSQKARYYFNIKACLKRLNTPPEKRA